MNIVFMSPTHGIYNRGAENSIHNLAENIHRMSNEVVVIGNGKGFFKHSYKYHNVGQPTNSYPNCGTAGLISKIRNRLYLSKFVEVPNRL
jgi:hypothetical protein